MVKKKIIKKKVNIGKDNTLLVIGALVIIGILLLNYSGIPTGQTSKGQSYEKKLHTLMYVGNAEYYGGYEIELIGVTSNGDAIVSVDGSEPQVAWWSGCNLKDQGTWIRSSDGSGLNIRVCATSYDMQQADLDFRL